ncbi:sensor histidine kinase [Legionella septentrionalis]|uniref:histidine kinase n=2 Tax=Legionellaceae TaxID=444 RepID=A0A433JJC5_9GAMM|nr:sensor histidine kinase [Legionella septentrionalis]RUQ95053.1 sensor histidine kinase [Legionella septentrionalis]RUR15975.1 sensor histidine kinase [Legionella septentrionalis]
MHFVWAAKNILHFMIINTRINAPTPNWRGNPMDATLDLLRQIILNVPNYIFWKDRNLIYRGCNKNFARSLGFNNIQEIIGKSDYQMPWAVSSTLNYIDEDNQILATGHPILDKEIPMVFPNGKERILSTSKVPLYDNQGMINGILGIYVDITHLKEDEKILSLAKEAAESANQAKTQFIANMSHDLRTPLSGVVGMSELLRDKADNPEQRQYAEWIHDCSQQLLQLLNGILDIVSLGKVKEDELKITTFDIRECIAELVALEIPTIKIRGLNLLVNIDNDVPKYIDSDRIKLHRIMLNLLGNAIKFTDKGHVAIDVKLKNLQENEALIYFAVADTGIGIPEEQLAQIFDRFHRINPSYKGIYEGHGVGLHIAQSYIALLGGDIEVKSKPGAGTTFSFELPLKIGRAEDAVDESSLQLLEKAVHATKHHKPKKIVSAIPHLLLVEDNLVARHLIENLAAQCGCQFMSAESGEAALELINNNEFDLIITDIGLPGMSGHELTQHVREKEANHKNHVPIVGLTALARNQIRDESLKLGMDDVFNKPISLALMETIINQFLDLSPKAKASQKKKEQIKAGLGADLPETESELFNLNDYKIFDLDEAKKNLGDENAVKDLLRLMLSQEMQTDLDAIKQAHRKHDWEKVEKLAHKMKGGALYLGTIKMKYACQYLERYQKAGHTKLLEPLYQQLIKIVMETQNYITKWLQQET